MVKRISMPLSGLTTAGPATPLLKIMLDPAAPASTSARAADNVLDHAKQAIEIEGIEARVVELERADQASGRRS